LGFLGMDGLNNRPKKREDLAIQEVGNEFMLYDETNEKIHVLNHTAYLIWKLCDGNHTINDIENEISKNYSKTEYSDILQDIGAIIEDFDKIKLII
jgi:hypothetical protein